MSGTEDAVAAEVSGAEVSGAEASSQHAQLAAYWDGLKVLRSEVEPGLLGTSDLAVVFSATDREHDQ